uniref:Junction mediating and regulatory protein, p53 cofactor n=1 Tax=Erpetoichthys calabaricus TaxID=27687 RepID=A0A8C4S0T4_ERPCA
MSFTMEDTLESGWVAVRPNVFEDKEKHKFVFIAAWNEVEGKFAITCHNRTVQRQRTAAKEPTADGTRAADVLSTKGEATAAAPAPSPPSSELKSFRSPVKERAEGWKKPGQRIGEPRPRSPADTGAPSPSRAKAGQVAAGRRRSPGKLGDIEILEPVPGHDDSATPEKESAESEELDGTSREECSWAGLFSFQDLRTIHSQLCAVNSDLEPCLPLFPEEPSGMWTVLFGPSEISHKEMDTLCYQLQVYLGHALDTCGWKILSQVLFTETDDPEEYYESLSELRQKGYEEVLHRARKRLYELLEKHKITESMVELLDIYQVEDEAYNALVEATTELYQYLLQPFRDMRELAMLRRQQIKISMENDYLGPRRIESLKKEDSDWQKKSTDGCAFYSGPDSQYFEITARAQKAVYDRMKVDQKKFGKAAWAAAVERMERLQYAVSKETLQLMRAKEICLEQKKRALKNEMQSLQGGDDAIAHLDQLESNYYDLQLQLYEIQFEILKCEELLLTAQLESIKRQIIECQDEVVYYDTYESLDAMGATEDMVSSVHHQKEELVKLQQRVRQLEARRGRISAKKAYLRNKREICIVNHNEKMQRRQISEEDYTSCHAVQMRKKQQQEEDEKKSFWVSQERQKTLDRLKSFKQRYPGQVILKSTRLRLASSRRKNSSVTAVGSPDQSQSLAVSVQTEDTAEVKDSAAAAVCRILQEAGAVELEATSLPPESTPFTTPSEVCLPLSLPPDCNLLVHTSPAAACESIVPTLPPPPPPPLPPPPCEDVFHVSDMQSVCSAKTDASDNFKPQPSAQLFDSSQLVNARKKLKKTSALEASQKRRVSSPMDEVLASLKRGSFHLRKVEQRTIPPSPEEDDSNNILAQIRKGVKLKKVQREELKDSLGELPDSTDPLTRSIHEALRRIKEASPESESEDESLPCTDWEN